jgi:hypothetical protein
LNSRLKVDRSHLDLSCLPQIQYYVSSILFRLVRSFLRRPVVSKAASPCECCRIRQPPEQLQQFESHPRCQHIFKSASPYPQQGLGGFLSNWLRIVRLAGAAPAQRSLTVEQQNWPVCGTAVTYDIPNNNPRIVDFLIFSPWTMTFSLLSLNTPGSGLFMLSPTFSHVPHFPPDPFMR